MSDPLSTYLHDHLGGAKAAIDLLEAMRDGHKDRPLKDFAASLLIEVQADRDTLQRLAEKVGSGSNALKEFSGWLAEKVTRLKLGPGSGGRLRDIRGTGISGAGCPRQDGDVASSGRRSGRGHEAERVRLQTARGPSRITVRAGGAATDAGSENRIRAEP